MENILKNDRMSRTTLFFSSNKVDLPGSTSAAEIIEKLGLDEHKERDWFIQATCGVRGLWRVWNGSQIVSRIRIRFVQRDG